MNVRITNKLTLGLSLLFSPMLVSTNVYAVDAWTIIDNYTTHPPYQDDGAPHSDYGADIEVDSQGNLVVTGGWNSVVGGVAWSRWDASNFFVGKYDSAGNRLWLKMMDTGWNVHEVGISVELDRYDNIYVLGKSGGDIANTGATVQKNTPFIAKFDPNGNLIWIHQFGDGSWMVQGMSTDKYGNSYILGTMLDSVNQKHNIFVRKYTTTGYVAWNKVFTTPRIDLANAIVIDKNGWYVYVAYTTDDVATVTGGNWNDLMIKRLGNSGTEIWERRYATLSPDSASVLAVNQYTNQLVIGGTSIGNILDYTAPINVGQRDTFVGAVSIFDGRPLWVHKDYAIEHGAVGMSGIVIDSAGGIHITGKYGKNSTKEFGWGNAIHYTKYDAAGSLERINIMGTNGTRDIAGGVAVDSAGSFYLTGGAKGDLNGVPSDANIDESDLYITKNMPTP